MSDKKKRYRRSAYLDDFQMDADGKYIYTGKRYGFDGEPRNDGSTLPRSSCSNFSRFSRRSSPSACPDGFTLARMVCPALSAAALLLFFTFRRGKWIELP